MAPPRFTDELSTLYKLAVPVAFTQLGMMMTTVVDTMMVGHLGNVPLAALALGNTWNWAFLVICLGLLMGLDPLIAQAHGRGNQPGCHLAMHRGIVLAGLMSIPAGLCMWLTEPILLLTNQDPEVARLAQTYNVWKLPTVPALLGFTVLRQYLQGRAIMAPAAWAMVVANLFNVLANWALIWGHLGMPALGLKGAAIATSLTSVVMVLALDVLMRWLDLNPVRMSGFNRQAFSFPGLRQILVLGWPIGLHMGLEHTAFGGSAILAGWIGVHAVGGHHVTLSLAALAFMIPMGISMGAATRVGNLIGAQDVLGMRRAVRASLVLGGSMMLLLAAGFLLFGDALAAMYTTDQRLIKLVASVLPIVACFQVADGLQVVSAGILRGMGHALPGAAVNLLSYYIIACPLAYVLAFTYGYELHGIWMALAVGVTVAAILLIAWTFRVEKAELQDLSHRVHESP